MSFGCLVNSSSPLFSLAELVVNSPPVTMSDYWQYSFPPFFTIQPNTETRRLQMDAWTEIILDYCRRNRIFSLNIGDCLTKAPFRNDAISRSLTEESLLTILQEMAKRGRIEWVRPEGTSEKKNKNTDGGNRQQECLVFWLKPDEWASTVEKWVDAKSMANTICTFYEITDDERADSSLKGLDERILLKALKILEDKGKATIMKMDNSYGVKFL